MSSFKRASKAILDNGMAVPLTIVFALLLGISGVAFLEDYTSSLRGYMLLPTNKAFEWTYYIIALLPQAGQIGLAYVFIDSYDEGKQSKLGKMAGLFAASLFLIDVGTDVLYRGEGRGVLGYLVAFFESLILFTGGSEFLFTVSIGVFLRILPVGFRQVVDFFENLLNVGLGTLEGKSDRNDDMRR